MRAHYLIDLYRFLPGFGINGVYFLFHFDLDRRVEPIALVAL